jgi:DNA-binding GntR family transcriptional regulator
MVTMTSSTIKPTRARNVYERLRADITMARFAPGERLKSSDLCERYGVSVSVVREALSALEKEHFVRLQPRYGYAVAPLTEAELRDLTEARIAVEGAAMRAAVEAGGIDWGANVVAAHHRLAFIAIRPNPTDDEVEHWHEAHEAFHAALLEACPSSRLRELARVLRAEAELYRRWVVPLGMRRDGDVPAEHQALVDAAIARDAETAADLACQHIQRTTDALINGLLTHPVASDGGGESPKLAPPQSAAVAAADGS